MALYILTCFGLSLLAAAGAGDPLATIPFPAFTGYYLCVGSKDRAYGIIAVVFLTGLMASGSFGLGLSCGLTAASGAFFARGWSFGWAVAAVTALQCALTAGIIASHPQEVLDGALSVFNGVATQMAGSEEELDREAIAKMTKELEETLPYTGVGTVFGVTALFTCLGGALLARRLRLVDGALQLKGRFREARTPDWLVWVLIGVAALWFIDDRWPNDAVRFVSWNAAIVLVFIYWMNGLGVLLYCLRAFKVSGIWYYLPLVLVFMPQSGVWMVLPMVGLFDTWWEMRQRFDAAAKRREDELE